MARISLSICLVILGGSCTSKTPTPETIIEEDYTEIHGRLEKGYQIADDAEHRLDNIIGDLESRI